MTPTAPPSRLKLWLAFGCVYLIWGSTYLGIRFAIETMPPLLMAGIRFLIAGSILYAWIALRREARRPTRQQWIAASLLGVLFFLGGNGGVSWAEQRVPSGLAALLVATIPFWIVAIDWMRGRGARPSARILVGVATGFAGVGLLVGGKGPGAGVDPVGAAVLIVAPICWAFGSVISSRLPHPSSHFQSGAMQMLAGGVALCLVGFSLGEASRFHPEAISTRSFLALIYLIFAGSIVAFSAYNWLLQATTPARVGTYAFVNPAVAVFLGWALAGEEVGPNTLLAGAFILTGVVLIITSRKDGAAREPDDEPAPPEMRIGRHPERDASTAGAAPARERRAAEPEPAGG